MRSDGYFGTQPSNDGCTPIDGQGTINCGVETTLIDCENGNQSNINYTDLSSYFVWNKTINQQVYIVFRFDQQVNISRISLYFWSQPYFGVDITIPDLTLYWSNDDPTTPSNNVSFDLNPTITRFGNERQRRRRNIDIIDQDLLLQFLRIVMTITEGTHVFLSEVLFCGKYIANLCHNCLVAFNGMPNKWMQNRMKTKQRRLNVEYLASYEFSNMVYQMSHL